MRNPFSSPGPSVSSDKDLQHQAQEASSSFKATVHLQIEAIGYDLNQALSCRTLENIPVINLDTGQPAYQSLRLKRTSNSCALVRADDPDQNALISTIYRIGPGRRPRMRILPENSGISVGEAIKDENVRGEQIEVKSHSFFSREQVFDTSLGKYTWRYGTKDERSEDGADSLLLMERVDRVPLPDGTKSESGVRIAQFIRSDELRTAGSKKYSGGNGGRLELDLSMWHDEDDAVPGIEAFAVASCILMLKREADRFRDNNIAALT